MNSLASSQNSIGVQLQVLAPTPEPQRNAQMLALLPPVTIIKVPTQPVANLNGTQGLDTNDLDPQQVMCAQLQLKMLEAENRKQELLIRQQ